MMIESVPLHLYKFSVVSFFTVFMTSLQILEGLFKLPENRECADCHNKYAFCNPFLMCFIVHYYNLLNCLLSGCLGITLLLIEIGLGGPLFHVL